MQRVNQLPRSFLLPVVALLVALSGCDRPSSQTASGQRPVIAVSIFPLFSVVQQLSGSWADVQLLMPPGASPHDFEPEPAELAPLSKADVLVAVGMHLDEWSLRAGEQVGRRDLRIIRMSDSIPLASNPHLWMDPVHMATFVGALGTALSQRYPEHATQIAENAASLQRELSSLNAQFQTQLSAVPVKDFVAYHNAYDPLADRYGLRVVAHLAEIDLAPGGEVTPQDLAAAIEAVRSHHLAVIYAEPAFPTRGAEMLREQTGVRVMMLDDLGGPAVPGYESYQALLKSDVKTLAEGQSLPPLPSTPTADRN